MRKINRKRLETLSNEWDVNRNTGVSFNEIKLGSKKRYWWICSNGHSYQAQMEHRTRDPGSGCPYCSGNRVSHENCLASHLPELINEWHPTKNKDLNPYNVTKASNKKAWWICEKGHEYEAHIYSRSSGRQCPYCLGKKVNLENCLGTACPELSEEWHPSKNKSLTPFDVTPGSNKKVWWICDKGHEYESVIYSRSKPKGTGCPYCVGNKVNNENCLANQFPELAKDWHPTKNKELTPYDVSKGSKKRVWWMCPRGHSYRSNINNKTSYLTGCPKCSGQTSKNELRIYSELKTIFSDVQSRYKINNNEIDVFINELNIGIEYDGSYYHKGKEKKDIKKNEELSKQDICLIRVREKPLDKISSDDILVSGNMLKKIDLNRLLSTLKNKIRTGSVFSKIDKYIKRKNFQNSKDYQMLISYFPRPVYEKSFAHTHPEIAQEWDDVKNFPLEPSSYTYGSSTSAWWKCEYGHSFKAIINRRVNGTGCPYCSGKKANKANCIATLFPKIAKEWHQDKNNEHTPYTVTKGSNVKAWWICDSGHEYQAVVSSRTKRNGSGCPYCSRNKVCKQTSLQSTLPGLANEWHPDKNIGITPRDVTKGSNKKVWWICTRGHEFEATIKSRAKHKGTGCPYCAGKKINGENCLATTHPILSKEWHPEKNKALTPSDVTSGNGKKVWWICKKGHEYESVVRSRAKSRGSGCPYCSGRKASKENNLKYLYPDVVKDWDYNQNKLMPNKCLPGSHKVVWWVCSNGHKYKKEIRQKVKHPKCPYCN